ncbi:unnamed protein product [Cladocopium goreaui]|uniref:Sodium channel protein type 4 subunit alpha B (Voltage-gated sodium channel subunit alpha Nav1.4b) n=1 Tax=Cladocopium goreaui TaxID=2562237 RepID=A0A9P1CQW4_9DINO|nr:unnamed protein product [Cladocopium goreaui]
MAGNSISTSVLDAEDSRPLANLDFEELAADGGSLGIVLSYLEKQHRIIMDALTYQDEMLRSINHRVEREGSTVPALPEFRFHAMSSGLTNGLGTGSAGSAGSNAVKASKDSAKLRSPGEHSVAASLFTSYSQDDLMLRLGASQAVSPVRSQGQDPTRTKGPTETLVQRITRHVAFDIFFGAVVVTNAIFIGIDVGFHVGQSESRDVSFKVIQYVYTLAFTVEIFFRIGAEWHDGWTCRGEDRAWNCFDLFIVMVAWFEVSIDVIHATTDTQMDSIAGVIRVLRFVMALRTLVTSILSTLKAVFWALLLLFLIIYIFALLFTQAVDEFIFKENKIDQLTPEEASASDQYFGTLFHSMLTLFMSIAGGVSWEDAIAPLMAISTVWLLAFLFYVSFTYFAVLNVVTGVFCQSAIESAQQDRAAVVQSMLENKEAHLSKMRAVFSEIRENSPSNAEGDEAITFAMLEEKINSPTVQQLLETLGGPGAAPVGAKTWWLEWWWKACLQEFFMGCLRLGGNARGLELGKVLQDQQWLIRSQGKFQNFVEMELSQINEAVTRDWERVPYAPKWLAYWKS